VRTILLAAVPTALYSWLLWRLDRYEREPIHLLAVTFLWGALPALVVAVLAEVGIANLGGNIFAPGQEATLIAPLVEEPLKALALIALFLFMRREFNGVLDGIVYGALIGFGFAMSENMLYYLANPDRLVPLWLLRSVLFGFNHAFFTSIVGIALGLVRLERRRWLGYAVLPAALALAIAMHALHNAAVKAGPAGTILAWLTASGGVLVVLAIALLAQRNERHWVETQLTREVAGDVLDADDLRAACTPMLRFRDELAVLLAHGWLTYRHRRRFHHLMIELAFTKHQLDHGDRFCCQQDVDRLRAAVIAQRALAHRT